MAQSLSKYGTSTNVLEAMKILQLSHKPPYPPVDGGSIAINNISMGMAEEEGVELKLITINTPKHFVKREELTKEYIQAVNPEFVFVDTEVKAMDALWNLFSKRSYHIARFYSKELEKRIVNEITQTSYDYILFESIYLSDYLDVIRQNTKAKLVLRSHNIEYLLWKRVAEQEANPLKKIYLKVLANRLEHEELSAIHKYDAVVCVSSNDQAFYEEKGLRLPITSIPIGIDVTKDLSNSDSPPKYPGLFMLGALDWIPNQEGIIWFIENVWPKLKAMYPNLEIKIAGRRPSAQMMNIDASGVMVLGEIENAAQFLKENAIMLVPLFSGSGIRVKIIEGMMMGKVVVSTNIGAEGLNVQSGEQLLLANTQDEFVKAISALIENKVLFDQIGLKAKAFATSNFSNKNLNADLLHFLSRL